MTALDSSGNPATGYAGTIHFGSSVSQVSLPANATLTAGTGEFVALLEAAGNQTITANDSVAGSITGTSGNIAVAAGTATHFVVSAAATTSAARALPCLVTAEDQYGNTAVAYRGTVQITTNDPQAGLPAGGTLTGGVGAFAVTLKSAGSRTVTATDSISTGVTGNAAVSVSALALSSLAVSAPANIPAGNPFLVTVTAQDTFNNIISGYAGTVHFTSSDGQAGLPADATLTGGIGVFAAVLKTVGNRTISAADTTTGSIAGMSSAITVGAGTALHFIVTAPSASATAGTAVTLTVTVQDLYGNTATKYTGRAHFASSDSQAVLPGDGTLTNGMGTFGLTLKTAGTQSITVTDSVLSGIAGSTTVSVGATAATHLAVGTPGSITAGNACMVGVTAVDQYGNTAVAYNGSVDFSSTDSQANLPSSGTLTAGVGYFAATLTTAGGQTITATDAVTAGIHGLSSTIVVNPAAAIRFAVTSSPDVVDGVAVFDVSVKALDTYGNVATAYHGTVQLMSSDPLAGLLAFNGFGYSVTALPINQSLTNGVGVFTGVELSKAGPDQLTATDTVSSAITGGTTVTIAPAAAGYFTVSVPSITTAGALILATVTAYDVRNEIAAYTGTVHLSSTDGQAGLPSDAVLTNGIGYFAVVLGTAGTQSITATDSANGGIAGTSNAIMVGPAAASHLALSAPAGAVTGQPFTFTVTALDRFGNIAVGYSGTVQFSSSDGAATLPTGPTLAAGRGTFSATLATSGAQTLTATAAGVSFATSNPITTRGLVVTSLTPTSTGYVATFSKPFDAGQINIYDTAGALGPDDAVLIAPSSAIVRGSLLIDPTATTITFVKTATFNGSNFNPATGLLTPGTYTLTLRSAANGFEDVAGVLLDGYDDGTPGGNYTTTFTVNAPPVAVGIPSFARGPGNSVILPNNAAASAAGIPFNLSSGAGVTSGTFTLQYNSALLDITSIAVNPSLAGATFTFDSSSSPGSAVLDFTSPTALSSSVVRLGILQAAVPNATASAYKSKALLHVAGAELNGGAIAVVGDDAVQIVAYLGDAVGTGSLGGGDANLIDRVSVALDTTAGALGGFAAFRLADPVIVGDVGGSGKINGADVTLLNAALAGLPEAQIPPSVPPQPIVPTGPDPTLADWRPWASGAGEHSHCAGQYQHWPAARQHRHDRGGLGPSFRSPSFQRVGCRRAAGNVTCIWQRLAAHGERQQPDW